MERRDFLRIALGGAAAAAVAPAAMAQSAMAQASYPDRPIRLIVPFPPGGVNDAVARPWVEFVKTSLGSVVIENQGGAVGAAAAARANPDGYTLLFGSGATHVVVPTASPKPPYDPERDFEPIAIISVSGIGVAVHPSHPAKTLKELIDDARARPGKLSYASAGVGSATHLGAELFKSLTKTDIQHVPYRGGGPALNDLVGGHVPVGFINVTGQVLELQRAGKIRLLAVTTPKRAVGAPDLPTAEEAGVPGCVALNYAGIFAPAKTPRAIVDRVAKATQEAMANPDFVRLLTASGFEPSADNNPDAARRFVRAELDRWVPVIKEIGLKLE